MFIRLNNIILLTSIAARTVLSSVINPRQATLSFVFRNPQLGETITTGQDYIINWSGGSTNPITLTLKQANDTVEEVSVIASRLVNDGSYTWNIPNNLNTGSNYFISISDGVAENDGRSGVFMIRKKGEKEGKFDPGLPSDEGSADTGADGPTLTRSTVTPAASATPAPVRIDAGSSATPSAEASGTNSEPLDESTQTNRTITGIIVGAVIGGVVLIILCTLFILCKRSRRRAAAVLRKNSRDIPEDASKVTLYSESEGTAGLRRVHETLYNPPSHEAAEVSIAGVTQHGHETTTLPAPTETSEVPVMRLGDTSQEACTEVQSAWDPRNGIHRTETVAGTLRDVRFWQ